MSNRDEQLTYIGVEHFRICESTDRVECIKYVVQLASALPPGPDFTYLAPLLDSLIEKLSTNKSAVADIQQLLILVHAAPMDCDEGISFDASQLAQKALEAIIPVAIPDFHAAVCVVWEEMEPSIMGNDVLHPDRRQLSLFNYLAEWVARVDSPHSYDILMSWLKHERAWVRNQTAWALRHWNSPDLCKALCEALLMGGSDSAAYEHSFFLFWRLERLADPRALPVLNGLVGTGFDKERELPGNPPPGTPKRNMVRAAIEACSLGHEDECGEHSQPGPGT